MHDLILQLMINLINKNFTDDEIVLRAIFCRHYSPIPSFSLPVRKKRAVMVIKKMHGVPYHLYRYVKVLNYK